MVCVLEKMKWKVRGGAGLCAHSSKNLGGSINDLVPGYSNVLAQKNSLPAIFKSETAFKKNMKDVSLVTSPPESFHNLKQGKWYQT